MSRASWEKWKAEQATTSWRVWTLGMVLFLMVFAAVLGVFDLAGYEEWGLLSAAAGPMLGLTLARVIARRARR